MLDIGRMVGPFTAKPATGPRKGEQRAVVGMATGQGKFAQLGEVGRGRGDQLVVAGSSTLAMALRTLVAAHLPVPLGVGTPLAFSCSAMTP